MLPSVVATQIRNCVADYLHTTFRPTTPGFEGLIDRFLEIPENYVKGPFITFGLPFRPGNTGANFFTNIPLKFNPHLHQERAFQRLAPPYYQSTLIATGTGSGKTECFLLPLLEHCLQHSGTPGIKAILIYPMNALATDQAKRIARFIHNTPSLKGKVTAGLYVGDQDDHPTTVMGPEKIITDKLTLRNQPPDILLTNYKMLDYLLIQPETQSLWQQNEDSPETLRYIVVDEFHTFDGAQGTDLACLLRRLKFRLKTPREHLVCVGTSATLGGKENAEEMLDYASKIFAEPFEADALIEENRLSATEFLDEDPDALINVLPIPSRTQQDALRPDRYPSPEAYLRAQARLWLQEFAPSSKPVEFGFGNAFQQQSLLPDTSPQQLTLNAGTDSPNDLSPEWRIALGKELKNLPIVRNLVKRLSDRSQTYTSILETFGRHLGIAADAPTEYGPLLLDSLLSLIAAARREVPKPDGTPLVLPWVSLRVQYWFRELRRMVATVEAEPELKFSADLANATPDPGEVTPPKTLPVLHCRDCGAMGWGGLEPFQGAKKLEADKLKDFYQAYFARKPLVAYVFPCDETQRDFQQFCGQCLTINDRHSQHCQSCGNAKLIRVHIPDNTVEESRQTQKQTCLDHQCPYCEGTNGMAILGAQAASLTSAMIGVLYTTPFNADKKLLAFSDSVQDAAHRAGFYSARTYRTTLRTAIAQTIATEPQGLTLQALLDKFPPYWQSQLGSTANYIGTFLPTDLAWLREWDTFLHSDHSDLPGDSTLTQLVNERLTWEIVNQFGHRSAVGPSLEHSGVCAAYFTPAALLRVVESLHLRLSNELEALREVTPECIQQFVLGLLHHLRHRGGILQPATINYLKDGGNTYLWQKYTYMPRIGPTIPRPIFYVSPGTRTEGFEQIIRSDQSNSWSEDWTSRIFASTSLLLKEQLREILQLTFTALVEAGLLQMLPCKTGQAWGIPLNQLYLQSTGTVLQCDRCSHQITTSEIEQSHLEGMNCMKRGCLGHYTPDSRTGLAYYRQIYRNGQVQRIVAAEHTGLLSRTNRELLEKRFIESDRRCDPNLISATSTLEMGIDIGDLSSVFLSSVPPSTANFQQRIGRAGRRDGNALVSVIASGSKPHDLYFYADPLWMLQGKIETAGCYLDASAILQRQLTAFCLDNWVATGISRQALTRFLNDVLNALEKNAQHQFPYNWLTYIQDHQGELLDHFVKLFEDCIEDRTRKELVTFMEKGDQDEGGLRYRILNALQGIRKERTRLSSQIKTLGSKIKKLKEEPEALQDADRLDELTRERAGFRALMKEINQKLTLNFFTDEGLLPNYAFPEAGVTLKSILWRRKEEAESSDGKKFETYSVSYERPGKLAIRELVPSGVFYAEHRRVKIDQIDLNLSEPQEWRFCRNCNYAIQTIEPEAKAIACPQCKDDLWSDQGQVHRMLRLKQVMATTSDRNSRFGDDSDDRSPTFFKQHLLVDFKNDYLETTFLVKDDEFPFGFEYISRTSFRDINLGEPTGNGEAITIGGQKYNAQGFRICRNCGKVMHGNSSKDHTIGCGFRDKPDQAKAMDVLYLYREFESEAIRFLMPDDNFWTLDGLHSFVAALQLGLKQKFGGEVGHLYTTISEEPQPDRNLRKSFLYLYDSVPGGTGYLRQLIRNPDNMKDVFEKALKVVRACDCQYEGKDGCYKCLFAYRNSFDQDKTSRKKAQKLLSALLKNWSKLEETSTGLSAIRLNSNFESELERKFIEAIRRYRPKTETNAAVTLRKDTFNGKTGYYLKIGDSAWIIETQVNLDNQNGVIIPSRADFLIYPASSRLQSKAIAIFTDGWEYHKDRIWPDLQQRLAILRSNQFWCWSLTWDDITKQLDPEHVTNWLDGLNTQLNPQFQQNTAPMYEKYQCEALAPHDRSSSFEWLMQYLATPSSSLWQNWALLRSLAQVNPQSFTNRSFQQSWCNQVQPMIGDTALDNWDLPDKFLTGEVHLSPKLALWQAVDLERHGNRDSTGSLVLLRLDDSLGAHGENLKSSWNEFLRLLNLYQFLPHVYGITTTALQQGLEPLLANPPQSTRKASAPGGNETPFHEEWTNIKDSILDDRLVPAVERMESENWPLPEVGYELVNDQGTVLAEAELVWPTEKVAVFLTETDQVTCAKIGWSTFTIEDFLNAMDTIKENLKGV